MEENIDEYTSLIKSISIDEYIISDIKMEINHSLFMIYFISL
ncbi:hypothetical protein [Clostridium sartagoforme]|nr:hypothetical protein [Clostridium sartagoforme]